MKSIGRDLRDDEVGSFLRSGPQSAIVDISTSWCLPCRVLKPIIDKLAFEFEIPLIYVDGDSAPLLTKKYKIVAFPTLLFFKGGKLADKHRGLLNPEKMRKIIFRVFERPPEGAYAKAELAFRKAYRQADHRMSVIMGPPSEALRPKIGVVNPELDSVDRLLKRKVRAGRISLREAARRLTEERKRLYAPFQAEIEALRTAQAQACDAYETIMNAAVEAFTCQYVRKPSRLRNTKICLPGDASCKVI